mmetsp:Transcript_46370/g.113072  ORF Transcript_46370/g.113072 Transcript_46370/m.113072 type:complete len:300 (-) Transcript_46370:176-1075(-)
MSSSSLSPSPSSSGTDSESASIVIRRSSGTAGNARNAEITFFMISDVASTPTRLLLSSTTHSRWHRSFSIRSAASRIDNSGDMVSAAGAIRSPTVVATILRATWAISACSCSSPAMIGRTAPVSAIWKKSNALTTPTKLFVTGSTTGAPLNPVLNNSSIASSTVSVVLSVIGLRVMQSSTVFCRFVGVDRKTRDGGGGGGRGDVENASTTTTCTALLGRMVCWTSMTARTATTTAAAAMTTRSDRRITIPDREVPRTRPRRDIPPPAVAPMVAVARSRRSVQPTNRHEPYFLTTRKDIT